MCEEQTVTISKKEYRQLIKDSAILNALYAAGVDSWEGYEHAAETLQKELS
jgi:hypothetical protein